jgi:hypothetical protein
MKIMRFTRFRHGPLALFHKHEAIPSHRLNFLCLGATYFATIFYMVAKALDMKEAFKQMVTDMGWDGYMRTLQDTHKKLVQHTFS